MTPSWCPAAWGTPPRPRQARHTHRPQPGTPAGPAPGEHPEDISEHLVMDPRPSRRLTCSSVPGWWGKHRAEQHGVGGGRCPVPGVGKGPEGRARLGRAPQNSPGQSRLLPATSARPLNRRAGVSASKWHRAALRRPLPPSTQEVRPPNLKGRSRFPRAETLGSQGATATISLLSPPRAPRRAPAGSGASCVRLETRGNPLVLPRHTLLRPRALQGALHPDVVASAHLPPPGVGPTVMMLSPRGRCARGVSRSQREGTGPV